MFRTLFIVLAFAAYGAYSLVGSFLSKAPAVAQSAPASVTSAAGDLTAKLGSTAVDLAGSAAAMVTGLGLQDAPATGCSESLLSPQQVMDLLDKLPDGQRTALAKAMQASSTVWAAQLYQGELGMGLCLPVQGKLLRFPASATGVVATLPFDANSITSAVQSFAESVKN